MLAWGSLAAALGIDYIQHKRNRPTLCSTARKFVPPLLFVVSWGALTGWLVEHYIDGFRIDLDQLD